MDEYLTEFYRYLALEKNASALTVKAYREDLTREEQSEAIIQINGWT